MAGNQHTRNWNDLGDRELAEHLEAELVRIRGGGACDALGVAPDTPADAVRAAFLRLTKQYHPTRFARRDRAVSKLANEVYLLLKDAYQVMRTGVEPGARQRATTARPVRDVRVSRGTPMFGTRTISSPGAEPAPGTRMTPPTGIARVDAEPATTRRTTSAQGAAASRRAARISSVPPTMVRRTTSAQGAAVSRRAARTSTVPPATTRRTTSAQGASRVAPTSAQGASRVAPTSAQGADGRTGTAPTAWESALQRAREQARRTVVETGTSAPAVSAAPTASFESARALYAQHRFSEARRAFSVLAAADPDDRALRAYLHCARGRELAGQGDIAGARAQYARALVLAPDLEAARIAAEELTAGPGGGSTR